MLYEIPKGLALYVSKRHYHLPVSQVDRAQNKLGPPIATH